MIRASHKSTTFIVPQIPAAEIARPICRQWVRVIAASPAALHHVRDMRRGLADAKARAEVARAEAATTAPLCEMYKRKHLFSHKCLHCNRPKPECKAARDACGVASTRSGQSGVEG